MSYILQALKKSEQERELAAQSPAIMFAEKSSGIERLVANNVEKPASFPAWQKGLIALAALLLVLVLGYLLQGSNVKPADRISGELMSVDRLNPAIVPSEAEGVLKEVVLTEAVSQEKALLNQVDNEITELAIPHQIIRPKRAVEQASDDIKLLIPNIVISSHIYSSLPEHRSIVVNGERLVEADFITAQVQIKEITHQGMIIDVNGWPLVVSRSRGWSR
ncbi:MAG: general secretion pathway protein GspB [Oleispira sp.]